jgi:UTP--glucose-1-phosphate uridylyltransferase
VNSSQRIRKVVIPAAGLGTRFLPATKAVPKEMLPIGGRPLIQFAVEEAAASGLETVILVIGRGKGQIAEHFSRNVHLETALSRRGKAGEAEVVCRLSELADVRTVWQEAPLGLADAIRRARSLVSNEPFAVILPDALIDSAVPGIRQLMDCYEKHPGCIIATQKVDPSEVDRFGILDVVPMPDPYFGGRTLRVTSLTERPRPELVTSRYGIFGRYILEPEIFRYIENTRPGFGGELQLTDSLQLCSTSMPIYAYRFEGRHYDAGDKLGFLQATLAYSLKDPELARPLREYLATLEPIPIESVR